MDEQHTPADLRGIEDIGARTEPAPSAEDAALQALDFAIHDLCDFVAEDAIRYLSASPGGLSQDPDGATTRQLIEAVKAAARAAYAPAPIAVSETSTPRGLLVAHNPDAPYRAWSAL